VASGPYQFLGLSTLGYMDYADLETGKMLVAEPGEAYSIRAIDGTMAVPPGDGRWAAAPPSATVTPPPSVPPVPSPQPVPALEGGAA
jgi:hypothetical protein